MRTVSSSVSFWVRDDRHTNRTSEVVGGCAIRTEHFSTSVVHRYICHKSSPSERRSPFSTLSLRCSGEGGAFGRLAGSRALPLVRLPRVRLIWRHRGAQSLHIGNCRRWNLGHGSHIRLYRSMAPLMSRCWENCSKALYGTLMTQALTNVSDVHLPHCQCVR